MCENFNYQENMYNIIPEILEERNSYLLNTDDLFLEMLSGDK